MDPAFLRMEPNQHPTNNNLEKMDDYLTAIHCASSLAYHTKDRGTGRCRLSAGLFQRLSIKTGWILRLSIASTPEMPAIICLCTAWPDTLQALHNDDMCCLDDSTVLSSQHMENSSVPLWTVGRCHVLQALPPTSCRSFHLSFKSTDTKPQAASFVGLAIAPGAVVRANGKTRKQDYCVKSVNQGQDPTKNVCVVHFGTIVLSAAAVTAATISATVGGEEEGNATQLSTTKSGRMTMSKTAVVDELLKRIVLPYINLPREVHLKGVLLVGPPGVGKTFAVKALKALCETEGLCKVHIREISIPEVLSDDDPLGMIEKLLTPVDGVDEREMTADFRDVGGGMAGGDWATPLKPSATPSKQGTPTFAPVSTPSSSSSGGAGAGAGSGRSPYKWNLTSPSPSSSTKPQSQSQSQSHSKFQPSPMQTHDQSAAWVARIPQITLVVLDEVDALGRHDAQTPVQALVKQHLCNWFDRQQAVAGSGLGSGLLLSGASNGSACIVATSNRPSDVDNRLRRGGRLEREIDVLGSTSDRAKLIEAQLLALFRMDSSADATNAEVSIAGDTICNTKAGDTSAGVTRGIVASYNEPPTRHSPTREEISHAAGVVAEKTGGYVAADINALVAEARKGLSLARTTDLPHPAMMVPFLVSRFDQAMTAVGPSCLRGIAINLPNLSYDDVVGYEETKKTLRRLLSFSSPAMRQRVRQFGLKSPGGVLLHGPPGNSKTRLVLAAAAAHGLPVISLSSADVYSPYVGDAEAEIRKAFRIARNASPCVLFLDEMDALVTDRAAAGGAGVSVEARVLATLLTEMDGICGAGEGGGGEGIDRDHVIVMGATNRLDCIDAALLRKGRFHQIIHVPLPTAAERLALVHYFAAKCRLPEASIGSILASRAYAKADLSGADVENLVKQEMMRLAQTAVSAE